MKYVAVEGMVIVPVEAGIVFDGFSVITMPSNDVSVDGSGVYSGDIVVDVYAPTLVEGGFVAPTARFTLHSSAEKVNADEKAVLLEGDTSDTLTLTGIQPVTEVPQEFTMTIKVLSAGQTSMKAD
ncbi:MAG: hypothetical protein IKS96_07310 [Fibrobacter sp.]|nr:hypothetical protein [Fibrobacter sp.]MBR6449736.1 hypothetical protein [Fibrobacter sp.]